MASKAREPFTVKLGRQAEAWEKLVTAKSKLKSKRQMYQPPPRTDRSRGVGELSHALSSTVERSIASLDFDPPLCPELRATPVCAWKRYRHGAVSRGKSSRSARGTSSRSRGTSWKVKTMSKETTGGKKSLPQHRGVEKPKNNSSVAAPKAGTVPGGKSAYRSESVPGVSTQVHHGGVYHPHGK